MTPILATLTQADAGQARVAGFDVVSGRRQVRRRISLTGQFAAVDDLQTGEENLRMLGRLAGLPGPVARRRGAELLERFDLTDAGRRTVATWSGGMRRRLDLAAGLVADPEVVFLEEADRLAGQIALLDGGRVVATGSPAQLKRRVAGHRLDLVLADARAFAEADRRLGDPVVQHDPARLTVGVATDGSAAEVRALLDEVDPARRAVATFAVHSASLDDVFLALTGHPAGRPDHDKEPASV